ncbi:MAG TPA: NAD(P)-dependent oxidoreductase [Xanthobacteraceae bacterium]|jgi:phosphoglycerate dehydrogenase-like enzyme|nr:NAD(P)-dependent oxidoreductase [Xanthobacteraceae bacterium]
MKAVLYPFDPTEPIAGLMRDFPQLEWALAASPADIAREIGSATILVTSNRVCSAAYGEALRRHADDTLRWIHFTSAGIDAGLRMGLPGSATLTNSTGVKAGMVSEHALALLLALRRCLPECQRNQQARRWRHDEMMAKLGTLEGAVVCVVGLGAIGRAVARKAKAFDARLIAVSRAATADEIFERVFTRERIVEAFAIADAVVVCTSSEPESFHLIDAAALAALRPAALLVNVARGELVDGAALAAALAAGRLGGAALDVTEAEPLAPASPLWELPNVIISPHVAGGGSSGYPQQKALFGENLARFEAGRPLLNICRSTAKM